VPSAVQQAVHRDLGRFQHLPDLGGAEPDTSRSTSTVRWRGGSRWSATMNASPIASRCS
jgi:hypothetical protein